MRRLCCVSMILLGIIVSFWLVIFNTEAGKPGQSGFSSKVDRNSGETGGYYPDCVPGFVVVKIKSGTGSLKLSKAGSQTGISSIDSRLSRFGATSVEKMFRHQSIPPNSGIPDISRILRVRIPQRLSPVMVAHELARDPNVEYAEPVYLRYPCLVPNDSLYSEQLHLPQIYAPEAWDVQKGDSTVLIAIVDTGTDYEHEDLQANAWTNELEANGITGVDDDGNGFVDDIHGWDFGDNDPDPTNSPDTNYPGSSHGTYTAGIACAVTNNETGIAGVSWNCRYMPIKVMPDDHETDRKWYGYEGIIYAADNGADIISNSWGGYHYSKAEQDVINYAYAKGAIIVCSAGNHNDELAIYPASCQHVISVAAVKVNDSKASYSTFGLYIDISAPGGEPSGVEILSTIPGNGYFYSGGTSAACPVVAGVCGLVKSLHPDWTNDQIVKQVLLTSDNIDLLNPEYIDKLGHGRVNAFRALTETDLAEPDARLAFFSYLISDSLTGNDDGVLDRGETIRLSFEIQNCSIGSADAATLQLSCESANIEMLDGTVGPVSFPADTTLPFEFSFRIADNATAQIVEFVLKMETGQGYYRDKKIQINIGKMPLLLVDLDMGSIPWVPNVEQFFSDILDKNDLLYEYGDTQTLGFPKPKKLDNFPIVILSCSVLGSLYEQDRNTIRTYLDGGGNLLVCGQGIGYPLFITEGTPESKAFMRDYLHADFIADNSEAYELTGVLGDAIGNGMSFIIWEPLWLTEWQLPDVMEPTEGASTIFSYSDGRTGAIKYAGDHKVVYLGFGLEAVDSRNRIIGELSPIRTELLMRIINWINFIEHEPIKDTEDVAISRTITAKITGGISELLPVTLFWRLRGAEEFTAVTMTETGAKHYTAEIPAPGSAAAVEYYLQTKHSYYDWTSPVGAPDTVYIYYAGPDTVKPEIAHVLKIRNRLTNREPYPVHIIVTDSQGIDSSSVYVHYTSGNRAVADSLLLAPSGEADHFVAELPKEFSVGDSVKYKITAKDLSVARNTGSSEWQKFVVGYEDFENGLQSWQLDPEGWSLSGIYKHGGSYSVNNAPGRNYSLNMDVSLSSAYGVDLSATDKAVLSFWTIYNMETDKDFGYIEISADSSNWQKLYSCTGKCYPWKKESLSLAEFTGAGYNDVRIRFRFISDSTQSEKMWGWFIDDVRITPDTGVSVPQFTSQDIVRPTRFALHQNYPNPFNPITSIKYDLPESAHVRLAIYDLLGRHVRTLVDTRQQPGCFQTLWDGTDEQSLPVAAGMYFCRMIVGDFKKMIKLVLLK